jgi:multidrug efflux pump subunit AcrB
MGFSGRIATAFQANPLTPILALAALLLGLVAVLITPREEEPQIDVTMANVFVPFPGASSRDVEDLVALPLGQVLLEIEGVKHVYSVSRPGMAVITVEYVVGVPRQDAIVRLYNQVYSNADWVPLDLGVGQPLIRPMGIDDVPVMGLTLWTDDPARGALELAEVAHTLEAELKRITGTRDVYTIGAPDRAVIVEVDATRMAAYGLAVQDLAGALRDANLVRQVGHRVETGASAPMTAGAFLADAQEISGLVIGLAAGRPVFLADVAMIHAGADLPTSYVWHGAPPGRASRPEEGMAPAVTLAIAKQPGANAADITRAVSARVAALHGVLIPEGINATITRDYGETATDKAATLMRKLFLATMSVVLLVLAALGWREAIVVGVAVVVTLALTLFASWAIGFTLNRVSLFALIFAIGILVDDAIVVVENIHRHMRGGGKSLLDAIPAAVDEVGGPTILATFTVIAALMPMAFVTGLMGPYMRPIPINASAGMLLSLVVALVVTPWLTYRLMARHLERGGHADEGSAADRLRGMFGRVMAPFLVHGKAARNRLLLYGGMIGLVLLAGSLVLLQLVVLKMLPFDNKSEFQVVLDMPEGSTVEDTSRVLAELALELDRVPEVRHYQGYAGTSAPVTFNGLVRQYYLRNDPHAGDLQVNLVHAKERRRKSHDIARAVRPSLADIGRRHGASIKIVEVPPGPPVVSPLVAEVYGPDYERARQIGLALAGMFRGTDGIVDVGSTVEAPASRDRVRIDRERAARLGVSQASVVETLRLAVAGYDATYLRDGASKYAVPVRLRLPAGDQAALDQLLAVSVRTHGSALVPLSELVRIERLPWEAAIYHKDLLPVVYVTADEAGAMDSPLYGMFSLVSEISRNVVAGERLDQYFIRQPPETATFAIKWDGEWQVTYETFRDMGLAYTAGLILIYLLVVAQFRSYVVPLIIMAPIPLTVIGVLPGHALLGKHFTATSMIGMIALAGIIVRNSILLVDFINHALARGQALRDAVVEACAVRAQPIVLTALAAMAGAFFIIDDPIFNGLAISLIFGILVSTLLTLLVIPVLYYAYMKRGRAVTL